MMEEFEMSEEDAKQLMNYASLPLMVIAGRSPPDLINAKWQQMADTMGFDIDTVEMSRDRMSRKFRAVKKPTT